MRCGRRGRGARRRSDPCHSFGYRLHENWLTDAPLGDWYGVDTDATGRVAGLDLYLNWSGLTGPIPQTFLRLERLHRFYIGGNENPCVPGSSAFVAWLRGIERRDRDSDSLFCNAADVAVLKWLYELASGSAWTESAQSGWAGNLESITLTGPGGSATLDAASNEPMVILRNSRNGQVRAILRDPASAMRSGAVAAGQAAGFGMETLFSRGIPGAAAWRR